MAAIENLPTTTAPVVIDPGAVSTQVEPIRVIAESISTQSVEIDITSTAIQEVLPSDDFVIGVVAPNRKVVEKAIGALIGGVGFMYELAEDKAVKGLYLLRVISRIGPLQVQVFAEAFQEVSQRIKIYVEGNPVTAL